MKILICGSKANHAIEVKYHQYLNLDGTYSVEIFPAHDIFLNLIRTNLIDKLRNRLGDLSIFSGINKLLLKRVEQFIPDVLWVFKGMEIYPETLSAIKKKGIKIINYNGDHPFIFSGRGSGNKNVIESFKLYDAHLTYNTTLKKQIESDFDINTFLLPFGYDLPIEWYNELADTETHLRCCFIGNPDNIRIAFVRRLLESNVEIDLYGHGWEKFLYSSDLCRIFPAVYGKELWSTIAKYRVQLNIFRKHNEGSHNMRTFEIPAIGGIQLAPDTAEHRAYFDEGKEIFLYRNPEDCINAILFLIKLEAEKVSVVRDAARKRCQESGYSYETRAKVIAEQIKSIL